MREPLQIGGVSVAPGTRTSLRIPVGRRYTHHEVWLPTSVVHGARVGPRLFVCAAIHGNEINGVEIIRRLLQHRSLNALRGTLIAVPIVNVYGFTTKRRELPDGRDLNRTFPGSPTGSLTARLAHIFMEEVVKGSTHGIDLHTGASHRVNLPQIRGCLDDPETERLARAFGSPVILDANVRDGSLRQAVFERKIPMLLYEGGEALRFDEFAIRAGVRGILSVMRAIGMLKDAKKSRLPTEPVVARSSLWTRAPESGILHQSVGLGARVQKRDILGRLSDPLGETSVEVRAPVSGIVIGKTLLPLVNEGDALFHIATFERPREVEEQLEQYRALLDTPVAEEDGSLPGTGG